MSFDNWYNSFIMRYIEIVILPCIVWNGFWGIIFFVFLTFQQQKSAFFPWKVIATVFQHDTISYNLSAWISLVCCSPHPNCCPKVFNGIQHIHSCFYVHRDYKSLGKQNNKSSWYGTNKSIIIIACFYWALGFFIYMSYPA